MSPPASARPLNAMIAGMAPRFLLRLAPPLLYLSGLAPLVVLLSGLAPLVLFLSGLASVAVPAAESGAAAEGPAAASGSPTAVPKAGPASASVSVSRPRLRYALLRVEILPEEAAIRLNGEDLGPKVWLIALRPGEHVLEISCAGHRPEARRIRVGEGERTSLSLHLPALAAPAVKGL